MRTIFRCASLLMLSCALFSSCRTVYAPNALNVPLFQEKGEVKATIATNNLQVATALTEHIGVMANGYLNHYTSDDKTFKNNGKGAEIGVGYFGHTEKRITYEAYAGAGFYNVSMKEANATKTFNADAIKYFVQPAIGWVNPYFEVAVSPRLSVVKYSTPDITGFSDKERMDNFFDIVDQKPYAFIEPTLIVRGGYRFVKLQGQFGYSYNISKNNINAETGVGSIGLIFNIADWYKNNN